ncbi:MAG: histidine kinase [gamma proteobacterium symbiont of Lucinoma myriamae]|nr:histidine kinase [gamma proteobacterium symbiont of Lucinoma myriamae]
MVFSVVIIGELLAFILTLAPLNMASQRWNNLALISLFIQWNGLMCSAVLCLLRPFIKNYSQQFIAISSYLSILFILALLSELTFYIMQQYAITDIISATSHWEFLTHNLLIGGIISALALRYFYIQHQWRLKIEAESCTKLQLLQARIRPHFLFNSMNSIASLTRTRPDVAERITEDLAELFRMILRDNHELITWSKEKELSQRYIDIEQQRLGERLKIQWHTDTIPDNALIPALLIQPLLENAIFHGIEPEINGGSITVSGEFDSTKLKISIQNTNSKNLVHRQGNKMALSNIRERLHTHFPDNASITCHEKDDIYFAIVTMPYQHKPDE